MVATKPDASGERAPKSVIDFRNQRLLVIAPHPDDEVLGCGGLISRAKRESGKVFVLYLTVGTTADFSRQGRSSGEERQRELEKVARFLHLGGWRILSPATSTTSSSMPFRSIIL